MIYEKRLLVLGGAEKGCLRMERTAAGVNCALSSAAAGERVIVLRDRTNFFNFVGQLRGTYRFALPPSLDFDTLVAIVGDASGRLLMSGGFRRPMPWKSNLEDDLARAIRALGIKPSPKQNTRDIESYFLDIVPTDYDDTRVAEVNYYRSNLTEDGERENEEREDVRTAENEGPDRMPKTHADISTLKPRATDIPPAPNPHATDIPTPKPHDNTPPEPTKQPEAKADSEPSEVAGTEAEPLSDGDFSTERTVGELPPVSFYETIKEQVERLFTKNERYERLEQLLPESRWIRVNYDARGKYYLVGTIGDPVRYLCYGVPGEYSPTPPPELVGYCQWLAADGNDPAGKGFWIMYQDGVTGKSVL